MCLRNIASIAWRQCVRMVVVMVGLGHYDLFQRRGQGTRQHTFFLHGIGTHDPWIKFPTLYHLFHRPKSAHKMSGDFFFRKEPALRLRTLIHLPWYMYALFRWHKRPTGLPVTFGDSEINLLISWPLNATTCSAFSTRRDDNWITPPTSVWEGWGWGAVWDGVGRGVSFQPAQVANHSHACAG